MPAIPASSICYRAQWHPALDPNQHNFFWGLASKIKNFIFYFPISLVATCINPRTGRFPNSANFIQTPDGVTLGVHIAQPEQQYRRPDLKYVLIYNPLGVNVIEPKWNDFQVELNQKGLAVVSFNYRGLGSTWSPKDLVVDGESVYQFLVNHCQVLPENIHFYGQSLGGAVAASVKALHPESTGKYVGDRTFRSIFHLIAECFVISSCGRLIEKISSFVSHLLTACIAYPLYWLDLNLDTEEALSKMKGEKKIFYLSDDIITHGVSGLHHVSSPQETIHITEGNHFAPISYQYVLQTSENREKQMIQASKLATGFLAAQPEHPNN